MNLDRLSQNWQEVRERIAESERASSRAAGSVRLVAVTKRRPAEWVNALVGLGATNLGENYPQELWSKVDEVRRTGVRWHLIGHLQGNKAKRTLPLVEFVHGVDSLKLLKTIDELSSSTGHSPALCLQVNTSSEVSKHGWTPESLLADADGIAALESARVVGLMTMAALGTDEASSRPSFSLLRDLKERFEARVGRRLPELSMGMSGDFQTAIEEGATMVRVGSALFEGVDP